MLEAKYVVEHLAKKAHKRDSSIIDATYRFVAFLKYGLTLAFIQSAGSFTACRTFSKFDFDHIGVISSWSLLTKQ